MAIGYTLLLSKLFVKLKYSNACQRNLIHNKLFNLIHLLRNHERAFVIRMEVDMTGAWYTVVVYASK